jgi:formyl-CoA transferase
MATCSRATATASLAPDGDDRAQRPRQRQGPSKRGPVARVGEIDQAIEAWTQTRSVGDILDILGKARVPAGKVYTAKDIDEDPHFRARDMILRQTARDGYDLDVPGIVPKLLGTPGTVRSSAPGLGDDTDAVLTEAGFSKDAVAELRGKGVVS